MSNELNDRLRAALRPVDPGERFTQGVLARIASESPRVPAATHRTVRMLELRWWSGALLVMAIGLLIAHQWHAQHVQQGQAARRQVMEALRVTSEKLDLAYRVVKDKERSGA